MSKDQGLTLYPASQSFPSADWRDQALPVQVETSTKDAGPTSDGSEPLESETPQAPVPAVANDGESPGGLQKAAPPTAFLKTSLDVGRSIDTQSLSRTNSFPGIKLPAASTNMADFPRSQYVSPYADPGNYGLVPGNVSSTTGNLSMYPPGAHMPGSNSCGVPSPPGYPPNSSLPAVSTPSPVTMAPPGYPPNSSLPAVSTPGPVTMAPPGYPPNSSLPAVSTPRPATMAPPGYPPNSSLPAVPTPHPATMAPPGYPPNSSLPAVSTPGPATMAPPAQLPSLGPGQFKTPATPIPTGTNLGSNGQRMLISAHSYNNILTICDRLSASSQQCSYLSSLLAASLPHFKGQQNRLMEQNNRTAIFSSGSGQPHTMPSPAPAGVPMGCPTSQRTPPLTPDSPMSEAFPGSAYRQLWSEHQAALGKLSECQGSRTILSAKVTELEGMVARERAKSQYYRGHRNRSRGECAELANPCPAALLTKAELLTSQVATLNKELIIAGNNKAHLNESLAAEAKIRLELEVQLKAKEEEIKSLKLALEEANKRTNDNIQGTASEVSHNKSHVSSGLILPGDVPFTPTTDHKAATPPAPAPAGKPRRSAAKPRCAADKNSTSGPQKTALASTGDAATTPAAATVSAHTSWSRAGDQSPSKVVTIDLTEPPPVQFKPMKRGKEYDWLPSKKVKKPNPYPSERRRSREAMAALPGATPKVDEFPKVGRTGEKLPTFGQELETEMADYGGDEADLGGQSHMESIGDETARQLPVGEGWTDFEAEFEKELGGCHDDGMAQSHPVGEDWSEIEAEFEKELGRCGEDVSLLSDEPSASADKGMEHHETREGSINSLFDS